MSESTDRARLRLNVPAWLALCERRPHRLLTQQQRADYIGLSLHRVNAIEQADAAGASRKFVGDQFVAATMAAFPGIDLRKLLISVPLRKVPGEPAPRRKSRAKRAKSGSEAAA